MRTGAIHGALRKARVLSLMPLVAESTGIYLHLAARDGYKALAGILLQEGGGRGEKIGSLK